MAQLPSVLYYVSNKMDVGPIIGISRFKSLSKHLEVVIASCHIEGSISCILFSFLSDTSVGHIWRFVVVLSDTSSFVGHILSFVVIFVGHI